MYGRIDGPTKRVLLRV